MSAVTLRTLAQRLGVSTATISMVLNGKPGISEETRQRVLAEVKASGYCFRRTTAAPRKAKENICLIVCKKHGKVVGDTPFFSTLIESIEKKADAEGYRLNIRYLNSTSEPGDFDRSRLEGLLLLGTEMEEEDLQPFVRLNLPIVVLDNGFPLLPINTVAIDNIGGTVTATKHFLENGHTRIGYMKSSIPIRNFNERYFGYEMTMKQHGLRPDNVVSLESTMEGAYRDMKQWLASNKLTATAFVADNDFIALGAIRALHENGIFLGQDVSVVGFDDLPFARINEPALTTIRVFNDVMGAAAFSRMLEIIRNPDTPYSHTRISTELKARQSVVNLND
jgi:DNA-binding LacI/PurR family transcriptional regulator